MNICLRQKVIHVVDMGVEPSTNEYEVRAEALQSRKQERRHLRPTHTHNIQLVTFLLIPLQRFPILRPELLRCDLAALFSLRVRELCTHLGIPRPVPHRSEADVNYVGIGFIEP